MLTILLQGPKKKIKEESSHWPLMPPASGNEM